MNAISLDTFSVMGTRILGPLLAGYLISLWGVTPVFGTRALGAAAAIFWLSFMQTPATPLAARQQNPLYNLKEGFRFLNDNRLVLSLAALYLIPMFFGWSYQSLLPAFADEVLHAGAKGLGYLHAATGIGSMVSLLILAYLGNFKQQGRMLFVAGIFLGITITLFSGSHWFLISSVLLVITGSFNTTFYTVNNTLIQGLVPDELRGRVMSLREMAMGTGAPIGGLLIGFMANHTSVTLATAIFGLACTLVVFVLAQLLPEVRKLTTR
jgi:MFS family permease